LDVGGVVEEVVSRLPPGMRGLGPSWRGCGGGSGVFIVLEGIDGAGVSTHTGVLAGVLERVLKGMGVVVSKEPTYGPVGLHIRQILRGGFFAGLRHPLYMAHLFAADRVYHVLFEELKGRGGAGCRGVAGCLQGSPGRAVVVDRYKYSSIVYQSVPIDGYPAPGMDWVWRLNEAAPPPHVLVYLDVEPGVSLERIVRERWGSEAYETMVFLEKVRSNYQALIERLEREGEIQVSGDGRVEQVNPPGTGSPPAWTLHTSPCIYPPGRYPVVVRAYTGHGDPSLGLRESAYQVVRGVLEALLERGLLAGTD